MRVYSSGLTAQEQGIDEDAALLVYSHSICVLLVYISSVDPC